MAARDEARKKLDERSRKIAARPMRAPRWNEDAIEEAELEMTAEETAALAACQAAANPDESLACNARFQEVTAERRKAERAEMRAVPTPLHAVRIPIGAIDCCEVCKAAIATGSSMCATCVGLFDVKFSLLNLVIFEINSLNLACPHSINVNVYERNCAISPS